MPEKPYILNDEQKQKIKELWEANPKKRPSLKALVEHIGGKNCPYFSELGIAIRQFMLDELMVVRENKIAPLKTIELSGEQKETIRQLMENHTWLEIAKILFPNKRLQPTSPEIRAITSYGSTVKEEKQYEDPEEVATENYLPPKSPQRAILKIRKYLHSAGFPDCGGLNAKQIEEQLKPRQKNCVNSLINYLNNYEFIELMNSYPNHKDRCLLEASFVNYVWDKPDLTAEELSQYIIVSNEAVISQNIQRHVNQLQKLIEEAAEQEDPKIRMGLIDSLSSARNEFHQSVNRREKLYNSLVQKRSKKQESDVKEKASLIEIIQYWQNAEKRAIMLKLAEARKVALKDEVKRLTTIDDLKAEIFGMDPDELIDG